MLGLIYLVCVHNVVLCEKPGLQNDVHEDMHDTFALFGKLGWDLAIQYVLACSTAVRCFCVCVWQSISTI